ncbi:hypothetical protein HPB47_010071 [Ixodes persulcatus]|uniref:Uncharacterized protein n=1 Tax=Ixodes persulcatus TaxID=34615 RepID=A0AC60P0H3_IXOPE|nr:hypothetical protein HPB47_010071 [Ixodes persulcatus]
MFYAPNFLRLMFQKPRRVQKVSRVAVRAAFIASIFSSGAASNEPKEKHTRVDKKKKKRGTSSWPTLPVLLGAEPLSRNPVCLVRQTVHIFRVTAPRRADDARRHRHPSCPWSLYSPRPSHLARD